MPTWFTQPVATLAAAFAALLISIVTTLITLWNSRRQDSRGAFRDLLTDNVAELSDGLHQIIATSHILLKTKSPESQKAWVDKGSLAKAKLMNCRSVLRYPLWGVTDSLNTLARLPSWAAHAKRYPSAAAALVDAGDKLREKIDDAVFYAVMKGKRPKRKLRKQVLAAEKRLIEVYQKFRNTDFQQTESGPRE